MASSDTTTTTKEDQQYPLAQGLIDAVRLNTIHFLWKKEFPWVVHPSIDLSGVKDEELCIADVGCGTGIWLLEASEQFPHAARLDGLDIVLDQVPQRHFLPENVRFEYLDACKEIPEEFRGRYDLVNAKFLLGLVRDGDPGPLVGRLLSMLKPGGYIQWSETDWGADTDLGLSDLNMSLSQSGLHALRSSGAKYLSKNALAWPMKLPTYLSSHGVEDIVESRTTPETFDKRYARAWNEAIVAAAVDGLGKIPKEQEEVRREMVGLVEGAKEDVRKGVAWVGEHLVVCGRKGRRGE